MEIGIVLLILLKKKIFYGLLTQYSHCLSD